MKNNNRKIARKLVIVVILLKIQNKFELVPCFSYFLVLFFYFRYCMVGPTLANLKSHTAVLLSWTRIGIRIRIEKAAAEILRIMYN